MDAYWLVSKIFHYIFTHIGRNTDDFHEIHVEITLWMLYAADTYLVTVNEGKNVELLVLCILLTSLFELKATERDVHLWILAEDILFPTFSLSIETWLLDDVIRAVRIMDDRISSLLIYTLLAEISVDRTLLAVEVETEVVVHLVCV